MSQSMQSVGAEMGGMFAVLGKVMGAVMECAAAAGLSEAEMKTIKAKTEAQQPLTDAEAVKVRAFGALIKPALEKLDVGAEGAPMIAQMKGQFEQMMSTVGAAS